MNHEQVTIDNATFYRFFHIAEFQNPYHFAWFSEWLAQKNVTFEIAMIDLFDMNATQDEMGKHGILSVIKWLHDIIFIHILKIIDTHALFSSHCWIYSENMNEKKEDSWCAITRDSKFFDISEFCKQTRWFTTYLLEFAHSNSAYSCSL